MPNININTNAKWLRRFYSGLGLLYTPPQLLLILRSLIKPLRRSLTPLAL